MTIVHDSLMKMTASCSGTDVVVAFTGKIQAKFCTGTVIFAPGKAYYTLHTSCGT